MNTIPEPIRYGFTVNELVFLLGVSQQLIGKQAKKFNWQSTEDKGVAKYDVDKVRFYKSDKKDQAARNKIKTKFEADNRRRDHEQDLTILKAIAEQANTRNIITELPPAPPRVYHCPAQLAGAAAARRVKEKETLAIENRRQRQEMFLAMYQCLTDKAKKVAEAKHQMLTACKTFLEEGGYKGRVKEGRQRWNTKGLQAFCQAFIDGTLEVPKAISEEFTRRGKRSLVPASLLLWRDRYEEQNLYGLADHYVSKAGATILTTAQQDVVIGMIHDHPHVKPTKVRKALKARFKGEELASVHTVRRYMEHWKKTHASLYLFITNPDEWRSRHMFAFGDADEDVIRLNQRWEADSTKADIICTDGRCCVIGTIDVWSRRLKLHVSPTSKAAAIAALFRRCLIDWGVPQEYRTDCGADYTSFHIERICDAIDIDHHLCNEFHPEEKPHIERAFKTFSHGIVELLPGYIGHSVSDRKAIEARKSFASRLMTKGETVEVKLSIVEFQSICDRWTESMYHQDPHRGLKGMSPAAKARSWTEPIARIGNERALDILLYPAPSNDGWRVIGKKGLEVTFNGVKLQYKAGEFAGHEGERGRVLIDETDLGRAPVFLENGDFLCLAEDPHWYGISNQEVARHAKSRQKQVLAGQKAEVKRIAKQVDTRNIASEILKNREDEAAKIVELPKQAEEYTTSALEQAAVAVAERDRKTEIPCGIPIQEKDLRQNAEWLEKTEKKKIQASSDPLWDKYCEVRKKVRAGTATADEREFVDDYDYWLDTGKRRGSMALRSVG
jgi:hypothetical protein